MNIRVMLIKVTRCRNSDRKIIIILIKSFQNLLTVLNMDYLIEYYFFSKIYTPYKLTYCDAYLLVSYRLKSKH